MSNQITKNVKKARVVLEQHQVNCNENMDRREQISNENYEFGESVFENKTADQGCQVEMLDSENIKTNSFTCIKYICCDKTYCDVYIQTDLTHLSSTTANLVFWLDKKMVQSTIPECFKPEYANAQVIIDCTEFKIEITSGVSNKILTQSHYKKGFTAKVLIGISPSGFISFKSKVAGERKSDTNMTIEAQLVDLLEDGDEVLVDKGFPEIKAKNDQAGKKVLLVMSPFLEKKLVQ